MSEAEKEALVSEVNLLRELKHTNIVRYYDRIIDREHTTIYIVMEFCEGGDLASHIKRARKARYDLASFTPFGLHAIVRELVVSGREITTVT